MNYNSRSKSKRNDSDDEDNSRESFYKQKFYESLSQAEYEAKIINDQDINKNNPTETERLKKNLSLKMIKVIYSRKLKERKKLFLNKWKEKNQIQKQKEKKFKKFVKIIQRILTLDKLKKLKSKSQSSLKFLKFLNKLTYLLKKKRKLFTLRFFLNLKNFSTNKLLRNRVYKNLLNHLYYNKRRSILKSKLTQWNQIVKSINIEVLSINLNNLQNTFKKNYSNFFFNLLKRIFLFDYSQKKLLYLIRKKFIYKNLKQWNNLVDKNLIYGKIRRKNIQLAKIKKLLKRFFTKNNQKLKISFIYWIKQTMKLKFIKPARIIQKFMQFAKLRKNKWTCVRTISRQFKALYRLFNLLFKNLYLNPFLKFKNESKRRILIDFVINLKKKKLKNSLYAWDKIQNFARVKFLITNTSAFKIQGLFKKCFIQSKISKLIEKIRFLRKILIVKIFNNKIRNRFIRWKIFMIKISRRDDSKIIQKYLRKKLEKILIEKKISATKNLNKLFVDFIFFRKLKPFLKRFVKWRIIKSGVLILERFLFRILIKRSSIFVKKNSIFKIFKVLSLLRKENILDSFTNLKNFSEFNSKSLSAIKIQRYFRYLRQRLRRKDIKNILSIIFNKTNLKNRNCLKHVFTCWNRNLKNNHIRYCATKISNFVLDKWIKIKWKKFCQKRNFREKLKSFKRCVKSLKNFRKLFSLVNSFILRKYFRIIENHSDSLKKEFALEKILNNFTKRENLSRINSILIIWVKHLKNIKKTEMFFISLLEIQKKISFFILNLSLKLNFFNELLKTLKKKNFLKILKNRTRIHKNFEIFGSKIMQLGEKIENDLKLILREKIYKLFIYKILSNLIKTLFNKFSSITIKPSQNEFLQNMFSLRLHKSYFEGRKKLFYKNEGRTVNSKIFKFQSNQKKNNSKSDSTPAASQTSKNLSSTYFLHVTRALIKILTWEDKKKLQNFFTFYKFKFLVAKFKNGIFKLDIMQPIKQEIFKKIRMKSEINEKFENLRDDFYTFMRKFSIDKIKKISKYTNRISKLMYFINIINMQKNVSRLFYKKEIFRQLAFQCKLNRISKQKLSSLYKSFYLNYLETTSYLFSDQEVKMEYEEIRRRMIGNNIINFASDKSELTTKTEEDFEKFY